MEIDQSCQTVFWMNFNVHVCKCVQKYFNLNSALGSKCCLIITLVWLQNMKKICTVRLYRQSQMLYIYLHSSLGETFRAQLIQPAQRTHVLNGYYIITPMKNLELMSIFSCSSLFIYVMHLTTFTLVLVHICALKVCNALMIIPRHQIYSST